MRHRASLASWVICDVSVQVELHRTYHLSMISLTVLGLVVVILVEPDLVRMNAVQMAY